MAANTQLTNPFLGESEDQSPSVSNGGSTPVQTPEPPRSAFSIRPAASGLNDAKSSASTPPVTPGVPTTVQVIKGPVAPSSSSRSDASLKVPADTGDAAERRKRLLWGGVALLLVFLIAGGVYWWWQRPVVEEPATVTEPTPSTTLPVVTEEAPPTLLNDTASYRSENFKAGEIVLLGEAQFLQGDEGIAPLTLEGIRGEAFTEKNKQEVKLVITWTTNKLATAEVSYAKGLGQTPKIAETDDFAYDHSLILTGLDPASTYLYTIKATDRFGNIATSEPYAVFTGARSVSLFDLIAGAIGDVFGWAVK